MKTEELVKMLASGAGAVKPHAAARRYASAVGWGLLGAALLMMLLLGVRHALARAVLLPMFWVKVAYDQSGMGPRTSWSSGPVEIKKVATRLMRIKTSSQAKYKGKMRHMRRT